MASRSPRPGPKGEKQKGKKTFSTIYKNPLLNVAKIQKIPANHSAPEHGPVGQLFSIPELPSNNEWLASTTRELEQKESVKAVKKDSSRQLAPDPDFRRMPAEDIVRYLQKEQRLSFVPSSKSITSCKSSLEFNVENQKDNFISSSPPVGNPFHSKPKASVKSLARKIQVPWREFSTFTSPTAQRKKIFQNFHKTTPDPPVSPPPEANVSKSLLERNHWNTQLPTRSLSIEARKLLATEEEQATAKTPSHSAKTQKQAKAREIRRHITESQTTVISEGREMAALSKSTNGLAAIGKSKKLKLKKKKVSEYEYDQPPTMEGAAQHRHTKGNDSDKHKHREHQYQDDHDESERQVFRGSHGLKNMYISHYDGPDSNHQFLH